MKLKSIVKVALGLALFGTVMTEVAPAAEAAWAYSPYVSFRFAGYPKSADVSNGGLTNRIQSYNNLTNNVPVGGTGRYSWIWSECQGYNGGAIYQKSSQSWVQSYAIAASCNNNWQDTQRYGRGAVSPN